MCVGSSHSGFVGAATNSLRVAAPLQLFSESTSLVLAAKAVEDLKDLVRNGRDDGYDIVDAAVGLGRKRVPVIALLVDADGLTVYSATVAQYDAADLAALSAPPE